jgi:hypothetical protein
MMQNDTNAIGRELKAYELQPKTIVVTNPEHRPNFFAAMRIDSITADLVILLDPKPVSNDSLCLFRQKGGTLKDGLQRTVRIFEYLGKP